VGRVLPGAVTACAVLCAALSIATAAPARHPAAAGIPPAGEVVMGTLSAPPTEAFLARVGEGKVGGVLLLGRWRSPTQVTAVTAALQEAACLRGEPLLVAVDQEGGGVRRLSWAPPSVAPAAMVSAARARSEASTAAAALRRVGVDVDFAPVADAPSSAHSFLGTRAFSSSPRRAAELTTAFVGGLQRGGVAATAKHFPGLGEAPANTDDETVTIRAHAWKLRAGLVPFRAAVAAGVRLVMVSSAAYPALDPSGLPAVFSKRLLGGLLRDDLRFDGVAVTDALDAPGAARFSHPATRAIAAGTDLLVFGSEIASERAYATLVADERKYPHLRARLAESAGRIRELKAWLAAAGGPTCP
jgi:beta-N-acetylhexosaminidase